MDLAPGGSKSSFGAFSAHGRRLLELGYSPVPLRPMPVGPSSREERECVKVPAVTAWQNLRARPLTIERQSGCWRGGQCWGLG